jgi:DNA replication protein DnaC
MADDKAVPLRRPLTRDDLVRMNLPDGFWRAKIQGVPESVRAVIERYMRRIDEMIARPAGILLHGGAGVGKTGIAAVIAKEARARGFTVYFVPVWELREAFRNRVQFDPDTLVIDRCRDVDLLVLDGLRDADAKAPMFGARELEDLVGSRGARRHPTIITTQLAPGDMREPFGGLLQAALATIVPLDVRGPNRREEEHARLRNDVMALDSTTTVPNAVASDGTPRRT